MAEREMRRVLRIRPFCVDCLWRKQKATVCMHSSIFVTSAHHCFDQRIISHRARKKVEANFIRESRKIYRHD